MLDFFGIFGRQKTRRIKRACFEGFSEGQASAKRDYIVRALRFRFPNENEKFFSSCVEKLEKKSVYELDFVFDVSLTCSNATEFTEAL